MGITAVDSKGLSPPLACAANEDVAMCLAMILSVFLATPANSKARRSICSLSSLRLSDSSFSNRLSEMGLGGGSGISTSGSGNDVTFTVDGISAGTGNTSLTGTGNTSSGFLALDAYLCFVPPVIRGILALALIVPPEVDPV